MQGLAQLVTILFILTTFGVGLFFIKRHKVIRYILHSLSGLFLAGLIIDPHIKSKSLRDSEKQIVGYYKLDVASSKFDTCNMEVYSDVLLNVKSDNTFSTTRPIPFLKSQTGKWDLKDNGDFEYLEYSFENSNVTSEIGRQSYTWTFQSTDLVDSNVGNKIIFKRK